MHIYNLTYPEDAKRGFAKFKKIRWKTGVAKVVCAFRGTWKPSAHRHRQAWTAKMIRRTRCLVAPHYKQARLVYEIKEDVVIALILSAFGHYEDK